MPGHIYYRTPSIYLRNNKMRQQDDGVLSSPVSQGSDSGETPLFVRFSHIGNIVEQHWSPYGVYKHFLWHRVAEMIEPQSGTITFGISTRPYYYKLYAPCIVLMVGEGRTTDSCTYYYKLYAHCIILIFRSRRGSNH